MPARNSVKTYIPIGYYHVYNRGVNKRSIFKDEQDYGVFLSYLKTYLSQRDDMHLRTIISDPAASQKEKASALSTLQLSNYHQRVELLAYCLMVNHFHLLIKQTEANDMQSFLQSLLTRYTVYFNRRHKRTGGLFQGRYRAVLVDNDSQLLHLTRYIHRNPIATLASSKRSDLFCQPSSYQNYLGKLKQEWVKPDFILQNFSTSGPNSYQSFVELQDSDLELETTTLLHGLELD